MNEGNPETKTAERILTQAEKDYASAQSETGKYLSLTQRYCYRADGQPGVGVDIASQGASVVPWAINYDLPKDEFDYYCSNHPAKGPIQLRGHADKLPFDDASLDFVYCLKPGTLIQTKRGMIPVEAVQEGDVVQGYGGIWRRVVKNLVNQFDGELVSIKPCRLFAPLQVTPNHRILVYRGSKLTFLEAGDVVATDRLVSSFNEEIQDVHSIRTRDFLPVNNPDYQSVIDLATAGMKLDPIAEATGIPRSTVWQYMTARRTPSDCFVENDGWVKSSIRTVAVKANIDVCERLLRLIGYYIADGCASNSKPPSVCFYFGKNEKRYRDDVLESMEILFGVSPVKEAYGENKSIYHVRYCSVILWHLFRAWGGVPRAKKIADWLMLLPPEKQLFLLGGLFAGDGTVAKDATSASYASASPSLTMQVRELLLRQGFPCSVDRVEQESRISRKPLTAVRFVVRIEGIRVEKIAIAAMKLRDLPKRRLNRIKNNYEMLPSTMLLDIKSISKEKYIGPVHDLSLDATGDLSRTFSANGVLVHNCSHYLEDVLDWLPILQEWVRVLKPGGNLIILVPDKKLWNEALAHGQPPNCAHKHESYVGELPKYAHALNLDVVEDRLTAIVPSDYTILTVFKKR